MPSFWQSFKTPPYGRRAERSGPTLATIATEISPVSSTDEVSPCASRPQAHSPAHDSPVSPLTTPSYGISSAAESPILFPVQTKCQTPFDTGWAVDDSSLGSPFNNGRTPTRGTQSRPHGRPSPPRLDSSKMTARYEHELTARSVRHPRQHELPATNRGLMPPARPLRSVTSSPALSTLKNSETGLLAPHDHPLMRPRNASNDCQTLDIGLPTSLPCMPPDKPLPAIPTSRQRIPTYAPTPRADCMQDQYGRAPPSYNETQGEIAAGRTMSEGNTLSPRTRIVMDVLGHMVALLQSRDEASLMEFSSLVTAQTRDMRLSAKPRSQQTMLL